MVEILSIIGAIFEVTQIYLLGHKNKYGFIFGLMAGISWLSYTIITGNALGILIVCTINTFLNIRGWLKWKT